MAGNASIAAVEERLARAVVPFRPRRDPILESWFDSSLVWMPERGLGYFPVRDGVAPYDEAYFEKYGSYRESEIGRELNRIRVSTVNLWAGPDAPVVDVGIGDGAFVEARGGATYGYDVNPTGIAWLRARGLLWNAADAVDCLTFWDVLEHIFDPSRLLSRAERYVFVSLPIFSGPDHVLRSRHYRRDEHCWYFTRDGLVRYFDESGFDCVEHTTAETIAGREDIGSFVFRRVRP